MSANVNEASSPGTTMGTSTDDIDLVVLDMGRLCMNELYSDVEFLVEEQRLPAHRNILAARSEYFRAMLYGDMAESKEREIRLEVPVETFKMIMRYIYTGTLPLSTLAVEGIIGVLELAHLYGLQNVEAAIKKHLQQNLAVSNICMILDEARRYSMDELTKECLNFMDRHPSDLLNQESFERLSKESLEKVLQRDTFVAPEVEIFKTLCKWRLFNPSVDIKTVISHIRLPLMTFKELVYVVRPTGLFEPDQILNAIDQKCSGNILPHRCTVLPGEEVIFHGRYKYVTKSHLEEGSVINCMTVTVSGEGKWKVFVNSSDIWILVNTFDSGPKGLTKEIHFKKRPVGKISIYRINTSSNTLPEVKIIPKYTV
ncbi:BTB/POZ domain-containing protein 9-like [Drosophila obscura]|uniref:BTB/POZ domain-containing protein 9-like n=1 Tax=Drosophila obscura TaxID=7282 RepID=UPI001BB1A8C5|nr:BTB/POZ domain-containing protein 9-like [Drosophila obscura]